MEEKRKWQCPALRNMERGGVDEMISTVLMHSLHSLTRLAERLARHVCVTWSTCAVYFFFWLWIVCSRLYHCARYSEHGFEPGRVRT